jgi:hypothetical protein
MPINRESIITVLRSTGGNIPDGLTFGEFGFAGANRQLFIGGTGGGASVESIWIGASITGTDIVGINGSGIWPNGYDSQYTLSTTKAVKKYIDDAVGTAGVVTSVNGNIGAITITGAGNNAAVVVRQGVLNGPHNIDARLATASLTGVASFNPQYFTVGANGAVTFSGASTVSIDGCFTSTYANYKILINLTDNSAAQAVYFKYRTGGVTNSTSAYYYATIRALTSAATLANYDRGNPATYTLIGETAINNFHGAEVSVYNPQATAKTQLNAFYNYPNQFYWIGSTFDATTSFDGINISLSSGTITGTIRVYGYKN